MEKPWEETNKRSSLKHLTEPAIEMGGREGQLYFTAWFLNTVLFFINDLSFGLLIKKIRFAK
jgi:hypothetical protein